MVTIPARVFVDFDLRKLWSELNSKSKSVKGQDWLQAWLMDPAVEPPPKILAQIKRCVEIFGGKASTKKWMWTDYEVAPFVCVLVDMVSRFILPYKETIGQRLPTDFEIGCWLVKHSQQGPVRHLLGPTTDGSNSRKAARLASHIRGDKPLANGSRS
jgi:hypothetical protein